MRVVVAPVVIELQVDEVKDWRVSVDGVGGVGVSDEVVAVRVVSLVTVRAVGFAVVEPMVAPAPAVQEEKVSPSEVMAVITYSVFLARRTLLPDVVAYTVP